MVGCEEKKIDGVRLLIIDRSAKISVDMALGVRLFVSVIGLHLSSLLYVCSCGSLLDPTTPVEVLNRKGPNGEDMHLGEYFILLLLFSL